VAGYFVIIGAFLAWEFRGLKDRKDSWPAFTEISKRWVPRWGLSLIIGALAFWLFEHFVVAH